MKRRIAASRSRSRSRVLLGGILGSALLVLIPGPGLAQAEARSGVDSESGGEDGRGPSKALRVPSGGSGGPEAGRDREDPRPAGSSRRSPGLDSLLKLPEGFGAQETAAPVAGASESEWRRRFRRSRDELREASQQLAATKRELDEVVDSGGGSQWAVAPAVGGGAASTENSPLSFRLREALKRDRERVEAAEKALRQLQIEADLAGVPRAWRGEDAPAPSRSAEP